MFENACENFTRYTLKTFSRNNSLGNYNFMRFIQYVRSIFLRKTAYG